MDTSLMDTTVGYDFYVSENQRMVARMAGDFDGKKYPAVCDGLGRDANLSGRLV